MRKYKIGITCYPAVGGSGVIATELGKMLAERGHQIHFITSDVPFRLGRVYSNIYFHEVEVNPYSVFKYPPYDISLASKMAEVAKREKLDLLHVHYAVPHAVAAFLAKKMLHDNIKVVTTLHGTDITVLGYDPSLSEVIRFGIEESDAVTAVSKSLIDQTHDLLDTSKEIVPIYNFVDERVYNKREASHLRAEYEIKPHEKVLVHISNFRKVKRVPDVVKVFEKVNRHIDSKLVLIGDGPEYGVVTRMVSEMGLEDRVLFLGKQENVAELLSMSDILLLLSEKESFGLVLLEAMACGLPCIGTAIGGIPEVIEHGVNGYLSELGDVEKMSEHVIDLLSDERRYEQMAENALLTVKQRFQSTKIVKQYESIYESLLEKVAKPQS